LLQELDFLRGGLTTKNRVAVGKPTEPFNYSAVTHGKVQEARKGRFPAFGNFKDQSPEKINGTMLVLEYLGVLQRKIEEDSMNWLQQSIFPRSQPLKAQLQRDVIESESLRLATVNIARELIGEED
jgi:hypothetical protein